MKNNTVLNLLRKKRPSGLIAGIVIGAASMFAIQQIKFSGKLAAGLLPGTNSTVCDLASMPTSNNTFGIISNEQEYNMAVNSYQQNHPTTDPAATWGGVIGKNHLIAIINSLGSDATEVNFKFITNGGNGKTGMYFQGGMLNPVTGAPSGSKLYIRTGSANDAFCPPRCP